MIAERAQAQNYAQAGVPRELGILERVDGIARGLHELHDKLGHFGTRLAGNPPNPEQGANGPAPGISGALSLAEARLRDCHQIVDALHKAF